MINDIIILVGIPASGKSTWRHDFLKNFPDFKVISTDDFIDEYAEQNNLNYSEAFKSISDNGLFKEIENKAFELFEEYILNNYSIIIDRTNMSRKSRSKFLSKVPKHYIKTAIVFNLSDIELNRRLQKRLVETGKHIPDFVIETMKKSYIEPSYEEFDKIFFKGDNDT